MRVLAISPLDKDASASIIEGGEVVFAAAEERFTRVKLQDGFPWRSIEAGFEQTGLSPDDVEVVAYPFLEWRKETKLFEESLSQESEFLASVDEDRDLQAMLREAERRIPTRTDPIHGLKDPNERMQKAALKNLFYRLAGGESLVSRNVARRQSRAWGDQAREYHRQWHEELEAGLSELGLLSKLKRSEHHLSHAANAYYASGFDEALIITLDGYGSGLAGSASLGREGRIKRLHGIPFPHSLGTFYESVTSSLGFRPSRHEGKIVGLAAFGDPDVLLDVVLSRFEQTDGDFRLLESNNVYFSRHLASRFPKIDVAAAYQRVLEVIATTYVAYWVAKTGAHNVVLSGGVTANVKLNQRVYEIDGVNRVFIYPAMGDGGCGNGLAMHLSWPGGPPRPLRDVYWGPESSRSEIEAELQAASLKYDEPADLAAEVARRIHDGEVVARFDGRMEFGPRALGNRSILYHARDPQVNQWLNQRLGRTEFMPFAPVTLWEARARCYENVEGAAHSAEFMTITFDCTAWMKETCPAAVHVDGTARPQLIRREVNPGYYRIIEEYEKLSGVPTLINTSFNMHEEPIVCSAGDAVRAFLEGNLDGLAIGPFLVQHPIHRRR
jgi:carbamoyltransferase